MRQRGLCFGRSLYGSAWLDTHPSGHHPHRSPQLDAALRSPNSDAASTHTAAFPYTRSRAVRPGVYVQITGTGGVGLNIRSDAGEQAPILFLGYDNEVYQITKGPKQADGYTWWYLTAPYDQTRSGWADQTYLSVLLSP